jgi:hypothetical protein
MHANSFSVWIVSGLLGFLLVAVRGGTLCPTGQTAPTNTTGVCCLLNGFASSCSTVATFASMVNFASSFTGYNLTVQTGHTLLLTALHMHGSFHVEANATVFVSTGRLWIDGPSIEFDADSVIHLVYGASILSGNGTCLYMDNTSKIILEFDNTTLSRVGNLIPVFNTTGPALCIAENRTGTITWVDVNAASSGGLAPPSWSSNTQCAGGSSLMMAFTISCPTSPPPPPPPAPVLVGEYVVSVVNVTVLTPSGANITVNRTVVNYVLRPANGSATTASAPDSTAAPLFDSAVLIVVGVILVILVAAVITTCILYRNPECRKRITPFYNRQHYVRKSMPLHPPVTMQPVSTYTPRVFSADNRYAPRLPSAPNRYTHSDYMARREADKEAT